MLPNVRITCLAMANAGKSSSLAVGQKGLLVESWVAKLDSRAMLSVQLARNLNKFYATATLI